MKKTVIAILLVLALITAIPTYAFAEGETDEDVTLGGSTAVDETDDTDNTPPIRYYKGVILKVEKVTYEQDNTLDYNTVKQTSEVEILTGPFKSRVYTISNTIQLNNPKRLEFEVEDKVMVSAELTESEDEINNIYIYDYYRVNYLIIALAIAAVILVAVSWGRGIKALVNIAAVAVVLHFYYIPLLLKGYSPVLLMLPICLTFAFVNILWDIHFTVRGFCTVASALFGITVSGLIGMLTEKFGHTIGLGDSELTMLLYSKSGMSLDFSGLSFALSMLLSLGAVINVCIYLSDYMYDYKSDTPYITIKQLFVYGFDVGRDAIGRNCMTLFFAAVAAMLPSWLVYSSFSTPLTELLNMDVLSSQMFRLLAGMIGICLAMPLNVYLHSRTLKGKSLY